MPPSTTSQDISTTTHHQLKFTHHHSKPPTESQNVYSNSDRKRYVLCCKRKVAAVKIEKLIKVFIFKCSDFSKTYSVQFHLFGSVNLSYFYFFIHGFQSSTLDKLKNTLNGRLKLNKANNRS